MLAWGKTPVPGIKICIGNCPGLGKWQVSLIASHFLLCHWPDDFPAKLAGYKILLKQHTKPTYTSMYVVEVLEDGIWNLRQKKCVWSRGKWQKLKGSKFFVKMSMLQEMKVSHLVSASAAIIIQTAVAMRSFPVSIRQLQCWSLHVSTAVPNFVGIMMLPNSMKKPVDCPF